MGHAELSSRDRIFTVLDGKVPDRVPVTVRSVAPFEHLWSDGTERVKTLLAMGVDGPAEKAIEEAAEVVEAARQHAVGDSDDHRVAEEAADLIYHLLVLLAERGVPVSEVIGVLEGRKR